MAERPICCVLIPSGVQPDPSSGGSIDFDRIYEKALAPAIEDAGLAPLRSGGEVVVGVLEEVLYERLLLCEYAVADMTAANPNVAYALGVRHAVRPNTSVIVFAEQRKIPFDVNTLRGLPYHLGEGNRFGSSAAQSLRSELAERLRQLRARAAQGPPRDSPLFELLDGYQAPDVKRLKTDVFRERVRYSERKKQQLEEVRKGGDAGRLHEFEAELGDLEAVESGVLVDLFLSYRALQDWAGMIELYQRLPAALRRTTLLREQLAFACNRRGDRDRALEILEAIETQQGPSSETCGLIGRVYKDKWEESAKKGSQAEAAAFLERAIAAYLRGFETDWRDHYPGINALTLLDVKGDPGSLQRKDELLPVVRFSVRQRIKGRKADYWDHATLLELAVLEGDRESADQHSRAALAAVREQWEPQTTARNLQMILKARESRGRPQTWLSEIIQQLSG